jgi:hypothetical protein
VRVVLVVDDRIVLDGQSRDLVRDNWRAVYAAALEDALFQALEAMWQYKQRHINNGPPMEIQLRLEIRSN